MRLYRPRSLYDAMIGFYRHEDHLEGTGELRNVCFSLGTGLMGFGLQFSSYRPESHLWGKDDTHNRYGKRKLATRRFMGKMRDLLHPPDYFVDDNTVAVLVPMNFPENMGHGLHQTLSLLRLIDLIRTQSRRGNTSVESPIRPQEVFAPVSDVVVMYLLPSKWQRGFQNYFSVGAHYPLINESWGAVFGKTRDPSLLRRMVEGIRYRLPEVQHAADYSSMRSMSLTSACFRRVVLWENCHSTGCSGLYHEEEQQSYAFGMWTPPTQRQQRLLRQYRNRVARCLFGSDSLGAVEPMWLIEERMRDGIMFANVTLEPQMHDGTAQNRVSPLTPIGIEGDGDANGQKETLLALQKSSTLPATTKQWLNRSLPHIFFDVRSTDRRILNLSIFANNVVKHLDGRATISFHEPMHGSRQYILRRAATSDIYFGIHGGAFSAVAVLPYGSVVIEVVPKSIAFCRGRERGQTTHCWFEKYSFFIGNDHVTVAWGGRGRTLGLSESDVLRWLNGALCVWSARKGRRVPAAEWPVSAANDLYLACNVTRQRARRRKRRR
jgi:hypothetical protein